MTREEITAYIGTLNKWEIARVEAVAIRNVKCDYCPAGVGRPCQINVRNEIGSALPGFAHMSRQIAWLEMADTLGESPMPAITDPEDNRRITALYGPDPSQPADDIDDLLEPSDDISDML